MQCNIDAKGKAVRLLWGVLCLLGAAAVAVLAWTGVWDSVWAWISAGVLTFFGLLGLYEGRKGWCVVRAMGIRTPW